MQQIAYLMSAITNQNASNNGQNGVTCNNGNGKFPNAKTQRPKRDQKDMLCWRCRGTGHARHLDKATIFLSHQPI